MVKKITTTILLFLIIFPLIVHAENHSDMTADIVGVSTKEDSVNIYFFRGKDVISDEEAVFLNELKNKYEEKVIIYEYDTWYDSNSREYMIKTKEKFGLDTNTSVPFTTILDKYYAGYTAKVGKEIEDDIINYLQIVEEEKKEKEKQEQEQVVVTNKIDIGLIIKGIVLGVIDSINSLTLMLSLIFMTSILTLKNKKRVALLLGVFLITILLNNLLLINIIDILLSLLGKDISKILIAILCIFIGIINIRIYRNIKRRKTKRNYLTRYKNEYRVLPKMKKYIRDYDIFKTVGKIILLVIIVTVSSIISSTVFPFIYTNNLINSGIDNRSLYYLAYILSNSLMIVITIIVTIVRRKLFTNKLNVDINKRLVLGIIMIILSVVTIVLPNLL
jgi:hypothetical protein